jgi:hypothetical protein
MQQCLEKDLKVVVSKPTPSDIRSIFKLKDLVRNKFNSIEFHCSPSILIVDLKNMQFMCMIKNKKQIRHEQ